MNTRRAVRPEPGLHLEITVDRDSFRVHRAGRIRHAPRTGLRAPFITNESARSMTSPTSEFALHVLDGQGGVLESFGWPYWKHEYYDRRSREHPERLVGPGGRRDTGIRVWRFPLDRDARFLYIVRSDVTTPDPERPPTFDQHAVALLWIWDAPDPQAPVPDSPKPPNIAVVGNLKTPPVSTMPVRPNPFSDLSALQAPLVGGAMLSAPVPVVHHGPVDECFNILVVGDGFSTDAEIERYDACVRTLFCGPATLVEAVQYSERCTNVRDASVPCPGLRHMAPFSKVWDMVNVWSIRAQSTDSGISVRACAQDQGDADAAGTPAVVRRTYFRTEGCFGKPNPGYVGTEEPERILEAATPEVPPDYVNLAIVIANLDCYGGRAVPDERMAFVTVNPSHPLEWSRLVAHECGHTIGHLAEERIVCVHKDGLPCQPNQARRADISAMTVWWKQLAWASELDQAGRFRATHCQGDRLDQNGQPSGMVPSELYSMLGAFWGCQNILGPDDPDLCDQLRDLRGGDFYRPMAECRMRWLEMEFCAVCDYEIASRVMDICAAW